MFFSISWNQHLFEWLFKTCCRYQFHLQSLWLWNHPYNWIYSILSRTSRIWREYKWIRLQVNDKFIYFFSRPTIDRSRNIFKSTIVVRVKCKTCSKKCDVKLESKNLSETMLFHWLSWNIIKIFPNWKLSMMSSMLWFFFGIYFQLKQNISAFSMKKSHFWVELREPFWSGVLSDCQIRLESTIEYTSNS